MDAITVVHYCWVAPLSAGVGMVTVSLVTGRRWPVQLR